MHRLAPALAALSLAALLPAQANAQSQAAAACLTEAQLANVIVYATPAVVTGVRGKCAPSLASSGFLATKGDAFASKYVALQNATWPSAKGALLTVLGSKAGGSAQGKQMLGMVSQFPDETVRPLVDGLLAQQVGEMIAVKDCGKAERAMQLASVMQPRDNAALMAFVLVNSGSKDLPVCKPKA
ncbi:hypothetical protein [Tsuneonella amylolytica]|uniref:hypothetical protein n=1 Tax=Tsuneonella amylolytica TaxID=2338327 RepID=UPI0013C4F3D3|nr:hypothetical protein [Tsuneonella amylolytica]